MQVPIIAVLENKRLTTNDQILDRIEQFHSSHNDIHLLVEAFLASYIGCYLDKSSRQIIISD